MVNYNQGKVYIIEPTVERLDYGDIYIGSTTKKRLSQRMSEHRSQYKRWKDERIRRITSFDLFDKYGVKNCKITLLEVCCCNSKDELKSRESHFIRTVKCVNKYIPNRTNAEYYQEKKDEISKKQKQYYLDNMDKLKRPFICQCGKECKNNNKTRHFKSISHLQYMNTNTLVNTPQVISNEMA
jgi:hypothetical protein